MLRQRISLVQNKKNYTETFIKRLLPIYQIKTPKRFFQRFEVEEWDAEENQ
jgi:hypothetical protein